MANGWTLERKLKQAALIQQWQPWKQSTGPKTPAGKKRVSQNSYKGATRAAMQELRALLKQQKRDLDLIK